MSKFDIKLFLKGMGMGAADVVPGVSGGTIAFITGIYDKLILSINSFDPEAFKLFFTGKFKEFLIKTNFLFLLTILGGILTSVFSLAKLISYLLKNYPVQIWSFFFGLVLASMYIVLKEVSKWRVSTVLAFIFGTLGAFFLVGMIPVTTPSAWWFTFLSGFIAISAMILPGISGSFMLVLLSQYERILTAVHTFKISVLLMFSAGAGAGIIAFSKILGYFLKYYRDVTMAVLSGFMLGSLRKVWPWKKILEVKIIKGKTIPVQAENVLPSHFDHQTALALFLFFLGILIIVIMEFTEGKVKKNER